MRVQRVVSSGSSVDSWTVLDEQFRMVEPVDAFLAHLSAVERSPNTVRAYAHDLRDFFSFLSRSGRAWTDVGIEDVGRFAEWLRLPVGADDERVVMLPSASSALAVSTVNRKLSAVTAFYLFHERRGVKVASQLTEVTSRRGGSWQPFLAHLGKREHRSRSAAVTLRQERRIPRTLTPDEVAQVLGHCVRLRDRLFFTVLRDTGLRAGEALGLRHDDIDVPGRQVCVRWRVNSNGARAKAMAERAVPAPAALFRLYSDYLNEEYGALDSDYVFVTFAGAARGSAWRYDSAHDLVERIRRASGVAFSPHLFRHTYATELLRRGVPVEIVQQLMGHASYATTVDTYAHLSIRDARAALERAGWLESGQRP